MTDSTAYIKWFCRTCLVLLVASMTYIVLLPDFSFSSWVPHELLRHLNIPYAGILLIEETMDKVIHFVGALIITLLFIQSNVAKTQGQHQWYLKMVYLTIPCLIVFAEFAQLYIGRSFSIADIIMGLAGFYLAIKLNNRKLGDRQTQRVAHQ